MKVFLSSTAQDLNEYRKVADDTILRLSQQSVAMERFGPLPNTPVEECERLAAESDVVICIVGHRYGYIPEKGRGSITRREVEAAHNAGKEVLVWIVADDHPWSELQEQDLLTKPEIIDNPEKVTEVTEAIRELIAFKAWLLTTFTPERFTTADDLGRKIAVALSTYIKGQTTAPIPQDKISISRLPTTGTELFGREGELQILDDAWSNHKTNMVSLVAWGGVGKTALISNWLKRRLARDNYRGAERVYAWSFSGQGSSDPEASADPFLDHALRWFGDLDPTSGSLWDKGERLAGHIRQSRTLLILDGLEALQHPPGPQEGRLKDLAMRALLIELAAQQTGLCVISSRERLADLVEFENGTVLQHDLDHLSPRAGAQILRSLKVEGDDEELEEAARELDGHAFSLTLLGSYLEEVLNGDIHRRNEIENLFDDTRYGNAAQRMIEAYQVWLGDGMELAILRLIGLFNRTVDLRTIEALRQPPPIVGLTELLQRFKDPEWNQAIAKLRRLKLLAQPSSADFGSLDTHPLVQEHFKQQLKREHPELWREANLRVYEHLKKTTKEFPDTVEEMLPLYSAVTHGCAADRHEEALAEIYIARIQRGGRHFNWHTLGAFGADLVALTGFFKRPWELPVARLSAESKALVLNEVGVDLRALGRLQDAVYPTRVGLEMCVELEQWTAAASVSSNLADLYAVIGDLGEALKVMRQGVEYADRSGDLFQRATKRATLANILHHEGSVDEAVSNFNEAEALLKQRSDSNSMLHAWWGFFYCDLLLSLGEVEKVKQRASITFVRHKEQNNPGMMGLDLLALGRAWMLDKRQSRSEKFARAAKLVEQAFPLLRQGGRFELQLNGLFTRAALHRQGCEFGPALRDLSEAFRIAHGSGMRLYVANYHLESAWLRLAQNALFEAREHLATAKEMINRMGYHRRDMEVQELEAQLA